LAAAEDFGAQSVWFGAAAPLGLLAPALRGAGITRLVATTHGHEAGWAMLPGARQALRRIGNSVDVVTYLGEYTRRRLAGPLGPHPELVQLAPGVDSDVFSPAPDARAGAAQGGAGDSIRARHGLDGRPVIVCVSRLVPRKGQDTLIRALPGIRAAVPDAALLLVGDGPYEKRLRQLAAHAHVAEHVVFAGAVSSAELPAHFRAGDLFAMPCRTRRFGLDVEGLGMVFLEASASGRAVLAGDSGGAPDAVREGVTGHVVDGRDLDHVTARVVAMLSDPAQAAAYGAAGRDWVRADWRWDSIADRLAGLLRL
jgi:phosphatidylinositol alpha-1,6-mannosyltransferase